MGEAGRKGDGRGVRFRKGYRAGRGRGWEGVDEEGV